MKNMILASTSTVYEGKYLDYLENEIKDLFKNSKEILFIPYARPNGLSHDKYTCLASKFFNKINIKILGIHKFDDLNKAIKDHDGIFIGGGNSFLLLKQLIEKNILKTLREEIIKGKPYLGTSAGINICGPSIGTSNDMPITHPSSFKGLNIIPFNINPHYLDPIKGIKHMGETRETRIKEFHYFNDQIVIGLREGSYIRIKNKIIKLKGNKKALIFEKNKKPYEVISNFNFNNLYS